MTIKKNKFKLHVGYKANSNTRIYTYFATREEAQKFWEKYLKQHNILLSIEGKIEEVK